jgi:hypothetical protein
MDKFKNIEEVLTPDDRWGSFVVFNEETREARERVFIDHYNDVANIVLDSTVPEKIVTHFITAKHLWVYSWFVYRFVTVAQLQAYASLEFALRERLGYFDRKKAPGFGKLLTEAVGKNLLHDEGFENILPQRVGIDGVIKSRSNEGYVRALATAFRELRNDLAHGSSTLMPDNTVLLIVAYAINQLFKK